MGVQRLAVDTGQMHSRQQQQGEAPMACLRLNVYTLRALCLLCLQGWKKFMEVSKVMEGFTLAGSLVIKAQVQVIR